MVYNIEKITNAIVDNNYDIIENELPYIEIDENLKNIMMYSNTKSSKYLLAICIKHNFIDKEHYNEILEWAIDYKQDVIFREIILKYKSIKYDGLNKKIINKLFSRAINKDSIRICIILLKTFNNINIKDKHLYKLNKYRGSKTITDLLLKKALY